MRSLGAAPSRTPPARIARHLQSSPMAARREPEFFSGPEQLCAVLDLLRGHAAREPPRRMRAWSAGCATGEEAYTLAILLTSAFPDSEIEIVGTDIDAEALGRAEAAIYSGPTLRNSRLFPPGAWFVPAGEAWRVVDGIREKVRFVEHDLAGSPCPEPARGIADFDLVVCRDVLRYLDRARLPEILQGLAASCRPWSVVALDEDAARRALPVPGFADAGHALLLHSQDAATACAA